MAFKVFLRELKKLIVVWKRNFRRAAQFSYRIFMRNRIQLLLAYFWSWGLYTVVYVGSIKYFMYGVLTGLLVSLPFIVVAGIFAVSAVMIMKMQKITMANVQAYLTDPLDIPVVEIEVRELNDFGL